MEGDMKRKNRLEREKKLSKRGKKKIHIYPYGDKAAQKKKKIIKK